MLTPKHVEENQTGTARPVLVDQKEEHKIDFRVPGLSHAVVKETEHLRVQGLEKKIENHPHREALHADLQQNNVYDLVSNNSKVKDAVMVLDMAKPKYKENTIWPRMRGRDALRKSTPKVIILQVFTIDFSDIQFIVNHNSQSDGQNKSAKSGMNLHKKTIHTHSRGKEKIQRTMVSYSEQSRQKRTSETSI